MFWSFRSRSEVQMCFFFLSTFVTVHQSMTPVNCFELILNSDPCWADYCAISLPNFELAVVLMVRIFFVRGFNRPLNLTWDHTVFISCSEPWINIAFDDQGWFRWDISVLDSLDCGLIQVNIIIIGVHQGQLRCFGDLRNVCLWWYNRVFFFHI